MGPYHCGSDAFAHSVTQERFIFELIPGKIIVVLIKGKCSALNAQTPPPAAQMIRPGKHSSNYSSGGLLHQTAANQAFISELDGH